MRKILLLLGATFFWMPLAAAQFTIVTGTVKDVNGVAYAGGTISASLVVPGGTSPTLNGVGFTGSMSPIGLDSTGSFTARLADNNVVLPGGTQWKFLVNHTGAPPPLGTGPQTCTATLTVTGASQSISSSFATCPALSNGCIIVNAVACVSNTNPQGWAGGDPGAWVNSALSTNKRVQVATGTSGFTTQIEMVSGATLELACDTFTNVKTTTDIFVHLASTVSNAVLKGQGVGCTYLRSNSTGTQFFAVVQDEGTDNTIQDMTLDGNGNTTSTLVLLKTTRAKNYRLKLLHDLTVIAGHNYAWDIRGGNNFDASSIETNGGALGGISIVTKDGSGDYGSITGGNFSNLFAHDSPHNGLDINVNASAVATANSIAALNFSNIFLQHNGTIANHLDDEYGLVLNATLLAGDTGSLNNLMFSNLWAFNNAGSGIRLKGSVFNCVVTANVASNGTDTTATATDGIVLATGSGTTHPILNTIIATGNRGSSTNFLSTQANSANNQFFLTTGDPVSLATTNDTMFLRGNTGASLTAAALTTPAFIPVAFASLGTPANGTLNFCNDCTIANPCAGGGTGALAKRLNGVWVCN